MGSGPTSSFIFYCPTFSLRLLLRCSGSDKFFFLSCYAHSQVAHFVTPFNNYDKLESIHAALNGLLPSDIRVREISPAVPEFHARFSAKSKIYQYKIYNDIVMDPFQYKYAYHSCYKLNSHVMKEAARHFVGKHDFSAFVNVSRNDGKRIDPVKNISRFDVTEMVSIKLKNLVNLSSFCVNTTYMWVLLRTYFSMVYG